MQYGETVTGRFHRRPNRFVAEVWVGETLETVHVKNTGRCRELLIEGVEVVLERATNPNRKTAFDLITVYKQGLGWVNMDSQAPNRIVGEWLQTRGYEVIRPEYPYGDSRIDFYLERNGQPCLMEVKGCTLEIDGLGYFPDAPTTRGVKHLRELTRAVGEGYQCFVTFVIQMEGVTKVLPNCETHPEFAEALSAAQAAGVKVVFLRCRVEKDRLEAADWEIL